jgi:hypothetical protein
MADLALINRLRKVLALTTSPEEGEAAAASAMLQKLLTEHNLSIADLEKKGAAAPAITEQRPDLGKAAFRWKLSLADAIGRHYYCHSIVDYASKRVAFVGRPDNVEALQMLYAWLIGQIAQIANQERKRHAAETGEHIDPLRWQVGFGDGAVIRLRDRLETIQAKREAAVRAQAARTPDGEVVALVLHRATEVSDYLEEHYGYRVDGQKTKWEREAAQRRQEYEDRMAHLRETNIEEYYRRRPWERPETEEEKAEREREERRERKRQERNARRRKGREYRDERPPTAEELRKQGQTRRARRAGHSAADHINLEPFLTEGGMRKPKGALGDGGDD